MKAVSKRENETVDQLIRRFKRKVSKEGILDTYRAEEYYVKPGERRRAKHDAAVRRLRRNGTLL